MTVIFNYEVLGNEQKIIDLSDFCDDINFNRCATYIEVGEY